MASQTGIYVHKNGQGVLEDNEIFANALSGIAIKEGGNPTVRRNRIHDGKQTGIFVYENGQGVLEDNDIVANALSGIEIKEDGNPTVRRNRIHDGKRAAFMSKRTARGCWKTTTSSPMRMPGSRSTRAAIRPCGATASRITAMRLSGSMRAAGQFEGNDLRGNKRGAWDIAADCADNVIRKDNQQ